VTLDDACAQLADAIRALAVARAERDEALADAATRGDLLRAALHELAALNARTGWQEQTIRALRDELRRYTARTVREGMLAVVRTDQEVPA
jgi:hypothetical protein